MRRLLCFLVVAVSASALAERPAAGSQVKEDPALTVIAGKVAEVKARLAAVPGPPEVRQACAPHLTTAEQAVADSRLLVALAALRRCLPLVAAGELAAAKKSSLGNDLDAFRNEWSRAGEELKRRRAAIPLPSAGRLPLAVRAMIESELQTFEPYYVSSRLYGENTTVENGLLYLGFPYGILEFAAVAASLPLAAEGAAPTYPDLGGALFALDGDLLDYYKKQQTPELRSALIPTSAIFKQAQDLLTAGAPAGTLLEYLRTIENFSVNRARATDPPPMQALRARAAAIQTARFGTGDHSIAKYFVERLTGLLAAPDPAVDERRNAAAILDDVLPAYDRVRRGDVPVSTSVASASGKPVTVTLVRWPYT